jgi:hypothetical protein
LVAHKTQTRHPIVFLGQTKYIEDLEFKSAGLRNFQQAVVSLLFETELQTRFSVRGGPDWVQNGADYNVYTMLFLKHPKLLVYDEKLKGYSLSRIRNVFSPANLGKWRIWRSCARPRWVGSARSISKDDSRQYPFQRALVCSSVSNNNETTACWKLRNPANSAFPGQN